jgi:hypothetical protein
MDCRACWSNPGAIRPISEPIMPTLPIAEPLKARVRLLPTVPWRGRISHPRPPSMLMLLRSAAALGLALAGCAVEECPPSTMEIDGLCVRQEESGGASSTGKQDSGREEERSRSCTERGGDCSSQDARPRSPEEPLPPDARPVIPPAIGPGQDSSQRDSGVPEDAASQMMMGGPTAGSPSRPDPCQSIPCMHNGRCEPNGDQFTCDCASTGFTGKYCERDIDECAEGTPCDKNADCMNLAGSHQCTCKEGYSADASACVDINECTSNPCNRNATCSNSPGGYECNCKRGYVGDGVTCADVDECAEPDACQPNATCINTEGARLCRCDPGYRQSGSTCLRVDPCMSNPCGANATCSGGSGATDYTCACNSGYIKKNNRCVDEQLQCDSDADCAMNEGCYRYSVPSGDEFRGCRPACIGNADCDNDYCVAGTGRKVCGFIPPG